MATDAAGGWTPTALVIPDFYCDDYATLLEAVRDGDGLARLCGPCSMLESQDPGDAVTWGIKRRNAQPWFESKSVIDKNSIAALSSIIQYGWWRTRAKGKNLEFMPSSLRFTNELSIQSKMRFQPGATESGPAEIFGRDLGLGCHVIALPYQDTVVFSDFESRYKRKGYGAIVFRQLLQRADRAGTVVRGHVEAHGRGGMKQAKLLRWYLGFGFEIVGEGGGYPIIERQPRAGAAW